jgi:DNA-binding NtrC family response regulator
MTDAQKNETILIVDDDDAVRDEIIQALAAQGFDAVGASDGRVALQMLEKDQVQVVVSDILMPRLDGIELLWECGDKWPGVKFIAISSGGSVGYDFVSQASSGFGAFATLEKPIDLAALLETVSSALEAN